MKKEKRVVWGISHNGERVGEAGHPGPASGEDNYEDLIVKEEEQGLLVDSDRESDDLGQSSSGDHSVLCRAYSLQRGCGGSVASWSR